MAEIAKLYDEDKRTTAWTWYYYHDWKTLPSQQQQSALTAFWSHPNVDNLKEVISKLDGFKIIARQGGEQAANKAAISSLNRLVAKEIVNASVGGVKTAAGRRGAVFIAEETATLAAARGANVAVTGVQVLSLPVSISAAVGEMIGGGIAKVAGVQNNHAKNALGAGGSMVGGATAGACVGGPVGAAAGAALGAGSWAVGQGISSILRTKKGPMDNWCFIEIGDIGTIELCVGTYAGDDTMYWKTYWNEYKKRHSRWVMSAGQKQNEKFQLCIWHRGRVIAHFNDVYYRDKFGIIRCGKTFRVVHCRGEYHPVDSGKVFFVKK